VRIVRQNFNAKNMHTRQAKVLIIDIDKYCTIKLAMDLGLGLELGSALGRYTSALHVFMVVPMQCLIYNKR